MTDSTRLSAQSIVTIVFVGTWIVLGVISHFAFFRNRNTAFKRAWYPPFAILGGILFVVFSTTAITLESPRWSTLIGILVIELPVISLIIYLNIRYTRFCEACGATQVDMYWLIGSTRMYCSACGARLSHKPTGTSSDLD